MLERYTLKEMEEIWSDANKFRTWLKVEVAILRARAELEHFNCEIPPDLENAISINVDEINRIEKEVTGHDMVAFLQHISSQFPEELRPWLHAGITSYDIEDTATSLLLLDSIDLLSEKLWKLMQTVKKRAEEYKYIPQIGRTHGIHAEPITFGVKLANWHKELDRHYIRLSFLYDTVSVGKISGAVGMYTLSPQVESLTCEELGLTPIIATQIISRDIIADYIAALGNLAATIAKISTNLRLLSQTEIGEIMEPFGKNQKGSSAMPHKKNPTKAEQLSGLMRVPIQNVGIAYQDLANCWHERSLDNSSAERVILADSSITVDYGLARLEGIIRDMRVFPKRMQENLALTKGLIFSQDVMMLLAEKSGLPREEAHTLVRDIALKCWEERTDFLQELLRSREIKKYVSKDELRQCFNLKNKLQYVDEIFLTVFS